MNFKDFKKKYQVHLVQEFSNLVFDLPFVSICIQTYEHESYIRECLDGILIQKTTFPFEILLGEDDSTDGTREICIEYAKKYPDKIRLFLHHRENNIYINGSPTGRFNFVYNFYSARGKYIALCEGDDYWTDPYKLQKQVDFLESDPNYNICFHNVKIHNQSENKIIEDYITREITETTDISELSSGNYIHTTSVVLRNNFIIPKWFSKVPIGDWALYMIILQNKKIKKLDDCMAIYRVTDAGVWSGKTQAQRKKMLLKSFILVYKNVPLEVNAKRNLKTEIKILKKEIFNRRKKLIEKKLITFFK
jgi:glycosyltransferase involved in cell wall biosynthesis